MVRRQVHLLPLQRLANTQRLPAKLHRTSAHEELQSRRYGALQSVSIESFLFATLTLRLTAS